VYVVAPERERSAASHSLSLTHPLRVEKISPRVYSVDGTPTDCSTSAVNGIPAGEKIDLLVSGINKGPTSATTSPTPAPSPRRWRERCLLGIPSIARLARHRTRFRFDTAAADGAGRGPQDAEARSADDTL